MYLQEFIDYRTKCPVCGSNLLTSLGIKSKRRHKSQLLSDRFEFSFIMKSMNIRHKTYKIVYSVSLLDSSVIIEFEHGNKRLDLVPLDVCNRFKEFQKNMGLFCFNKYCYCGKYHYQSNLFQMDKNLAPFSITSEVIVMTQLIDDYYRVYRLTNLPKKEKANLFIGKSYHNPISIFNDYVNYTEYIELPIIKINSEKEIRERLNDLLAFI